jgi:hypothetical protein
MVPAFCEVTEVGAVEECFKFSLAAEDEGIV